MARLCHSARRSRGERGAELDSDLRKNRFSGSWTGRGWDCNAARPDSDSVRIALLVHPRSRDSRVGSVSLVPQARLDRCAVVDQDRLPCQYAIARREQRICGRYHSDRHHQQGGIGITPGCDQLRRHDFYGAIGIVDGAHSADW